MSVKDTLLMKKRQECYFYRYSWFHLTRPLTLSGTISPVLVGTALAAQRGPIRFSNLFAFLIAALLVQIATNILNDYFDFKNGQDHEKWVKRDDPAYSHGPEYRNLPYVAGAMIVIAAVIGIWLAFQSSFWILIVGSLGIIFGYAYSAGSHSLSSIGLGELVAATFLGFVVTALSFVVQGYPVDSQIIVVSVSFALLISSMILSNNIRDIDKDKGFRRTLAIMIGRIWSSHLLTILILSSYVWVIGLAFFGVIPWTSLTVLLALPLAVRLRQSYRVGAQRIEEISGMKWAARHHWAFGLLFALGVGLSIG